MFVMNLIPFLCLLTILVKIVIVESVTTVDVIIKMSDLYNTRNLVLINCASSEENTENVKKLNGHGIRVVVVDYEQFSEGKSKIYDGRSDSILVVLEGDCSNFDYLLKTIGEFSDSKTIFNNDWKWAVIGNVPDTDVFSELNFNIATNFLYFKPIAERNFDVYDIYHTGRNNSGRFMTKTIGSWGEIENNFTVELKKYKYARRIDMRGVILKCMTVVTNKIHVKFYDYLTHTYETHLDSMNRFNFALLLHLKDIYNFDYQMLRTNSWGYSHNGTFDGMVGQLERKLIDIGGSPIFFRLERAKVVDYTIQTWISRPCFVFRHPKQTSSVLKLYLYPFTSTVWYCGLGIGVLILLAVLFLNACYKKIDAKGRIQGLKVLDVIGIVLNQGTDTVLDMVSVKITMLTVCIFSVLFYQYYSASIVSSLLMKPPKTIKTLQNLLDSSLSAGVEDIPYTLDYFAKTDDPIALKLYNKKILNKKRSNFLNPYDGLKIVKRGGFAFHVDVATAYKIIKETFSENEVCELSEIQLFPPQRMLSIVQKGSPYRKMITYGMRQISQVGLMAKERSVWHEKQPECVQSADSAKFKVTINEFSSSLVILLLGMSFSLAIVMIEIKSKTLRM